MLKCIDYSRVEQSPLNVNVRVDLEQIRVKWNVKVKWNAFTHSPPQRTTSDPWRVSVFVERGDVVASVLPCTTLSVPSEQQRTATFVHPPVAGPPERCNARSTPRPWLAKMLLSVVPILSFVGKCATNYCVVVLTKMCPNYW